MGQEERARRRGSGVCQQSTSQPHHRTPPSGPQANRQNQVFLWKDMRLGADLTVEGKNFQRAGAAAEKGSSPGSRQLEFFDQQDLKQALSTSMKRAALTQPSGTKRFIRQPGPMLLMALKVISNFLNCTWKQIICKLCDCILM